MNCERWRRKKNLRYRLRMCPASERLTILRIHAHPKMLGLRAKKSAVQIEVNVRRKMLEMQHLKKR